MITIKFEDINGTDLEELLKEYDSNYEYSVMVYGHYLIIEAKHRIDFNVVQIEIHSDFSIKISDDDYYFPFYTVAVWISKTGVI